MPRSMTPMCADLPRPKVPKAAFTRFPTWMWRNGQVAEFLQPAQGHQRHDRRSGPQGGLLRARYLQPWRLDRGGARLSRQGRSRGRARSRVSVMAASRPGAPSPSRYGRMALSRGYALCEKPVTDALLDLLRKRLDYLVKDGEAFFDAEQNARIVAAPSNITASSITATRPRGICATSTCSTRLSACWPIAGLTPRPWSGRTTPISAMRSSPRWARSRRAQYRAARAPAFRRGCGADRLRHRPRHRRRGVGLERAHGDQARAPCPRRFL